MEFLLCKDLNTIMESYFECFILRSVTFFEDLFSFMSLHEASNNFSQGEKLRSYYPISFKLEVFEFAEKKSSCAADLKYKLSIHDWKKKKSDSQELSNSVTKKEKH